MSFVSSNIKSAIICANLNEARPGNDDLFSFLFKVAFIYAEKGMSVCIIKNPNFGEILPKEQYLKYPEILQRIQLRYMKSGKEIVGWCHEIHQLMKKPSMLLIALDHFTNADDFDAICTCAALIDAIIYLSKIEESKEMYLLASTVLDFDNSLSYIHCQFKNSWIIENNESSIALYNYKLKNKSNSTHNIVIDNDSSFIDYSKIFEYTTSNSVFSN